MNKRQIDMLKRRVQRGATFLDGKRPSWFTKISTAKLDLSDCELCILGQLYSTRDDDGYHRGLELLNGVVAENPAKYGFDGTVDSDEYWEKLNDLWKSEIAARRSARRVAA